MKQTHCQHESIILRTLRRYAQRSQFVSLVQVNTIFKNHHHIQHLGSSEDSVGFCTADWCSILCASGRPYGHELIAPARIAVPGNDEIRAVYRQYLCDVGYNIAPTSSIRSSIGHKIGLLTGNRVQNRITNG